ncbi:MAG: flippase [Methanobrevibacter sp.]|uniref:flippase n=1 Tax=Methanobrevibacter sp. TaxID=66852 RepID=UPI0025EDB667|nr:flippase [Methanobrevibacter sp.]MBQ6098534.1 flippase [Methanobrevibacter sp.]
MVSKVRTIFANVSWLMVSQIITSACAFVWTILMARYLGPSDYGIFGTAVSFSVLFIALADFGVTAFIVRAISTDIEKEDIYLNNAISLKLFLSIFYLIVVFLASIIIGWDNYVIIFCMLYAFESLIKSFENVIFSSFQSHEQMKYQAITNTILNVLTLILIIFVTFTDYGLFGITFAYIFANLTALFYEIITLRKHFIKPKFSFDINCYKLLIKAGIPFALSGIFYTIYYSIDLVMISHFSTTYNTGLYNSAYKLISVLTLFYSIYTAVIFPVMSKLFKNEKDILHLSFVKSMKYLLLATVPIAIFTFFYGNDIIAIYGAEYIEAGGVLKVLIWTVCFLFVNGACSLILNASHKEYSVTKIYSVAALFNVILNLFLIPKYSVYGASVATVLSEILILVLEMYMIKKINQLPNKHFVFDVLRISVASGVLGIVLYVLHINMWIAMPVSLVVYFAVIFILRTVDQDDKLIIKQIIGR